MVQNIETKIEPFLWIGHCFVFHPHVYGSFESQYSTVVKDCKEPVQNQITFRMLGVLVCITVSCGGMVRVPELLIERHDLYATQRFDKYPLQRSSLRFLLEFDI